MKKSVFLMLGVAAMLASCSQDELGSPQGEGVAVITATVGGGMQTRVPTYDNDDVAVDRCLLEVYDQRSPSAAWTPTRLMTSCSGRTTKKQTLTTAT